MFIVPLLFFTTVIRPQSPDLVYRQPQLAAAPGMVAMVFGAGPDIYFASSKDEGRSFGPPVKVAGNGALGIVNLRQ
jgi:hypothetical protein